LYRFKRGGGDACLSCQSPDRSKSRADSWRSLGLKRRASRRTEGVLVDAPLTPDLKKQLDDYVQSILDADGYASLNPQHRLLRHLTPVESRDALMVYAEISREWCHLDHARHGVYHFVSYREDDEPREAPRLFDPEDYKVIDRYIAARHKPIVINTQLIDRAGVLHTHIQKQWLLIRSYFGLRPRHKVLWRGAITDRTTQKGRGRILDTYLVGHTDDTPLALEEGYHIAVALYEQETRVAIL
jgi:hypothetical protein